MTPVRAHAEALAIPMADELGNWQPVAYVPKRRDVIWLDFEPTKGREIGKYRPALVLSSQRYNRRTGLLICCPISTSIHGRATEVPIANLDKPSAFTANLVQTLAWRERKAETVTAKPEEFRETLLKLLPLMGALEVLQD